MKTSKKRVRDELKRMKVSFSQLKKEKTKKVNLNNCIKCKKEAGNNFSLVYKKNNELKGKVCVSCRHKTIVRNNKNRGLFQ